MKAPMLTLQLFFSTLALRLEWLRLRRCQQINRLPRSTWAEFKASQKPVPKPLAIEGSWDSVQDFEDMLRQEKASFVIVILRPHAYGVKASVVVRADHIQNFLPAFQLASMDLQRAVIAKVIKDISTQPPGEEWKG